MAPADFPATANILLRNARVPRAVLGTRVAGEGALASVDIIVSAGGIGAIAPGGTLATPPNGAEHDCRDGLVLPAFADIHTHLDKGQIWPRQPNPDGSFMGALLAVEQDCATNWSAADVGRRMDFSLRTAFAHGTAAIRTHIDSAPPQGAISWPVFSEMRGRWRGRIELQGVALVGPDVLADRAALADIARLARDHGGRLGGAIGVYPDSAKAMRNVVEVAGEFGLDIDLHCDETLDPEASSLRDLAAAVLATGFGGRVLAGHCCVLSVQDEATVATTIGKVVEAGIAIVALPMCNLYLQHRRNEPVPLTPRFRGVTLVNELAAAGVPVALASDNTRDPFYAYGDLDGLEVLREGAHIAHFDHPQAHAWDWLAAITTRAAAIAGFAHKAQIAVGAPADLILVGARDWTELLARPQADRIVLRGGRAIDTALPDFRELDDLMR